jgi:hypothetical protein
VLCALCFARRSSLVALAAGGLYPVPWVGGGAPWALDPLPFASAISDAIRSHLLSKEHMQLGWVVRWVLSSPPRTTPRLGGAAVSCQYLPCSFLLAPRAPALRLGIKAPPSRSALAPVESPSPGAPTPTQQPGKPPCFVCLSSLRAMCLQTRDGTESPHSAAGRGI